MRKTIKGRIKLKVKKQAQLALPKLFSAEFSRVFGDNIDDEQYPGDEFVKLQEAAKDAVKKVDIENTPAGDIPIENTRSTMNFENLKAKAIELKEQRDAEIRFKGAQKNLEKEAAEMRWKETQAQMFQEPVETEDKKKHIFKLGDNLRSVNLKLNKLYTKNRVKKRNVEVTRIEKSSKNSSRYQSEEQKSGPDTEGNNEERGTMISTQINGEN